MKDTLKKYKINKNNFASMQKKMGFLQKEEQIFISMQGKNTKLVESTNKSILLASQDLNRKPSDENINLAVDLIVKKYPDISYAHIKVFLSELS